MAKLFLGIALAFIIATVGIGFLAHQNAEKLQDTLKTSKSNLAQKENELGKAKTELKKTQDDLTAASATIEDQKTEIAKRKGENDKLTNDLATATAAVEAKTQELAKVQAEFEKMKGNTPGMTAEQIAEKMNQLQADLQKAQTELAESKTVQETLTARNKEVEGKYTIASAEVERYQKGIAKIGLAGRILAVNPGWNFVVLSVGDKQGAAVGANMLVMRGGEPIAKAKITSVEPSTSIADVIPGTIRRGVTVQPGDTVIYEGPRK